MSEPTPDTIHYLRIPNGMGARAEMCRMVYVLAGRPYRDALATFADAQAAVTGKNPFKQFPFVVTGDGRAIYQALAIMHHAAHGTSAWPSDPEALTRALSVAIGGYDLYQAFGGFQADDLVAKKKFEEKRVPQFFGAFEEIYAKSAFAAGAVPTFADCIVHEAVAWCARRNDVARERLAASPNLNAFIERFRALPAIRTFMEAQAAARAVDNAV